MKRFGASVEHIVPDPIPHSPDHDIDENVQEELERLRAKVEELSEEVCQVRHFSARTLTKSVEYRAPKQADKSSRGAPHSQILTSGAYIDTSKALWQRRAGRGARSRHAFGPEGETSCSAAS